MGKAKGADQWAPGNWTILPTPYIHALVQLLSVWERGRTIPTCWQNVVTLLNKPGGGRRPIGLVCAIMRIWGRARQPLMAQWQNSVKLRAHVGAGAASCEMLPYIHAIHAEAAFARNEECLGVYLDLKAAYEQVMHVDVLRAARMHRFPLLLWNGACNLYAAPRHLRWGPQISTGQQVHGGLIAGCSLATGLMMLLLLSLVQKVTEACPCMLHSNFVDDLGFQGCGTARAVIDQVSRALHIAMKELHELRMPLSPGKNVIVASTKFIEGCMRQRLQDQGFAVARQHRQLGQEAVCHRRRR
eukprot:31345-Amphidinium_carterae.1